MLCALPMLWTSTCRYTQHAVIEVSQGSYMLTGLTAAGHAMNSPLRLLGGASIVHFLSLCILVH